MNIEWLLDRANEKKGKKLHKIHIWGVLIHILGDCACASFNFVKCAWTPESMPASVEKKKFYIWPKNTFNLAKNSERQNSTFCSAVKELFYDLLSSHDELNCVACEETTLIRRWFTRNLRVRQYLHKLFTPNLTGGYLIQSNIDSFFCDEFCGILWTFCDFESSFEAFQRVSSRFKEFQRVSTRFEGIQRISQV